MNNYNFFERRLSSLLKSFPFIHSIIKKIYQNLNYFFSGFFSSKVDQCKLYSGASLNVFRVNELDKSHIFFGYYDHSPWSDNMRYLMLNVVTNHRLTLKLFESVNGDYVFRKNIVETSVFNFQQGIRAIWVNNDEIIFNCINNGQLVSAIYNIKYDTKTHLPYPVQEVKNNNVFSIDYKHLDKINKDYGYNLSIRGYDMESVDGILVYDYILRETKFNLKKETIHEISMIKGSIDNCEINHVSASPFNDSIIFIYRSKGKNTLSELYHFYPKGNNLKRVFSGYIVSHYCWISSSQIFIYFGKKLKNQGYYLVKLGEPPCTEEQIQMNRNGDGHPSLCPNNKFIVYDSYPDRNRYIHLNLYHIKTNKVIKVGRFFSPLKYSGYSRCDLHPRWSPDGNYLSIDSTHSGIRKHYMIDVSNIVSKQEYESRI